MSRTLHFSPTAAFLALALAASASAQCGEQTATNCAKGDIVETAVKAGSFTTLATALKHTGLIPALQGDGPFTVFAPTDEAFAKLPKGTLEHLLQPENKATLAAILKYHVVSGELKAKQVVGRTFMTTLQGQRMDVRVSDGAFVDQARIVKTDIACTNGVIHVIDEVILPTTDSILTTASKAGTFKTLAAAITAAELGDALSGPGPFTVFAPSDAAFAKLPKGTLASLLKPENKAKLIQILKLHVVSGRVYSDQALAAGTAPTLEGSSVEIAVKAGVARVNSARLAATDIEASNGVIHVIDTVLLPEVRVSKRSSPTKSWF
ncbi:MAG: fasciclin domain-containing protein [Planctomycetota bacterium]|jgi:uncharacterized surface protein with fasciclin (FAS1) repeats